jgi:hypothetical protein
MELIELKKQIYAEVESMNDIEQLEDCYQLLISGSHWSRLSDHERQKMIDMAQNPEKYKWYSHEEVMTKLKKWREK